MRNKCNKKIKKRIADSEPGYVFTITDFSDIAEAKTVSKTLSRLEDDGVIEKVIRGVFWKPDGVNTSPDPDSVARALARGNEWNLAPTGETALHIIGLNEEPPRVWTYVSDGTYRNYTYDGKIIRFCHTTGKLFTTLSDKTVLLIQVLRTYGRDNVSDELITKLGNTCGGYDSTTSTKIVEETKNSCASWITRAVTRVFKAKKKPTTPAES